MPHCTDPPTVGRRQTEPTALRSTETLVELNRHLRACRACHLRGFLDDRESVPICRDPESGVPMPRILLVGQAPGLRATISDQPFAGAAGERLRAWFEQGGIPRSDFWRTIQFAAVTHCYPGRLPGARGDRVPSLEEQRLCRPWLDELIATQRPEIILLVGLLAIRTLLGPVPSLAAVVGTATLREGVRLLPLPHPSGVSRWTNDPRNTRAILRAMELLRGWIADLNP